jgi:hypothetical protein
LVGRRFIGHGGFSGRPMAPGSAPAPAPINPAARSRSFIRLARTITNKFITQENHHADQNHLPHGDLRRAGRPAPVYPAGRTGGSPRRGRCRPCRPPFGRRRTARRPRESSRFAATGQPVLKPGVPGVPPQLGGQLRHFGPRERRAGIGAAHSAPFPRDRNLPWPRSRCPAAWLPVSPTGLAGAGFKRGRVAEFQSGKLQVKKVLMALLPAADSAPRRSLLQNQQLVVSPPLAAG